MTDILIPIAISAAIFLLAYRRVRRQIGCQRLSLPRILIRLALSSLIGVFFIMLPTTSMIVRIAGVALGAALGLGSVLALKTERVDGERFYTPNPVFGLLVVALIIGRFAYRLVALGGISGMVRVGSAQGVESMGDPIGRLLLLAAVIYYVVFNLGILIRSER